ncbi:MAG: hypothetical protein EP312_07385 [Gammaproteobacteria bacterium]|nr:MAG: hypothetical protein EP312_07385 [Gammaproteobacteria bacterium]
MKKDALTASWTMLWWLLLATSGLVMASPSPESIRIDVLTPGDNRAGLAFQQQIDIKQQNFQQSIRVLDTLPAGTPEASTYRILLILGDQQLQALQAWPDDYHLTIAVHVDPMLFTEKRQQLPSPDAPVTALFSGAPMERQWRLAQLVLPAARHWIIPFHELHHAQLSQALQLAGDTMELHSLSWGASQHDAIKALQPMLDRSDAILAFNQLGAITPDTIRSILLSAYRQGKPVIGMDAAYVRAGVLAAADTSVDQYTLETEQIIRTWLEDGSVTEARYPTTFSVHINQRVAKSLNLVLPDEATLTRTLMQQESPPTGRAHETLE